MTLNELIGRLEEIRKEHGGELPVTVQYGEYGECSTEYTYTIARVQEPDENNDFKRVVVGI